MNDKPTIGDLVAQLRAEYTTAIQLMAETGSAKPLVEFFEANDASLQRNYGVSLQEVLNIDPSHMEKIKDFQLGDPRTQGQAQATPQVAKPARIDWEPIYLIGGLIGGVIGIGLLLKNLK